MKKHKLLCLLNKSANSIILHDATLLYFKQENNDIIFKFQIGRYHYALNNIENYVGNLKNNMLLTIRFKNIKELCVDNEEKVNISGIEIVDCYEKNGKFTLEMLDVTCFIKISFAYENFLWSDAQEIT